MNWQKVSPKLIKSLVHGREYLLAYNHGFGWTYRVSTWYKFSSKSKGHFDLAMPKMIAEIKEPEAE